MGHGAGGDAGPVLAPRREGVLGGLGVFLLMGKVAFWRAFWFGIVNRQFSQGFCRNLGLKRVCIVDGIRSQASGASIWAAVRAQIC